ncbi:uncharacterized protein VP01_135g2 [Puccinia sorghi]|uniref:Uncharacterized protein n=1 Tax=Puccinia sorghi TaxID=27349 RepID=A0A0L6VLX1_9BASI|nr:uncharacterized protein VP01_135g2 [Puccinia sorghi]
MAECIFKEVPEFYHKTHLLRRVAHVINFAAKSALATFGTNKEDEEEHELRTSMIDFCFIMSEPDRIYPCLILLVTDLLCGSEYPTLNSALPIYLILMKQLTIVQNSLYNQGQLIDQSRKIFGKLNQYLYLLALHTENVSNPCKNVPPWSRFSQKDTT